VTPAPAIDEPRKPKFRRQPARKLRAWSATLKPNAVLHGEPPATIAVMRTLVRIAHGSNYTGELTYLEIAKRAGGLSWRQVQRIISWARAARLIHTARLGGKGRGQKYTLLPALAENFLGVKARFKRRSDMTSKSHQRARLIASKGKKERIAPKRDPHSPDPSPQTGARGAAGSGAKAQSGRGRVPGAAPENFAARSTASQADAPGASQRSTPAQAPARRKRSAEEVAAGLAYLARARDAAASTGPPSRRRR